MLRAIAAPMTCLRAPMRTELISIETDTVPLDGALYRLDESQVRGAILLFHGNVMNFYSGMLRFLPPALTALGFVCLAFNRRSHDILATYESRARPSAARSSWFRAISTTIKLPQHGWHDRAFRIRS
jgi:hypothetical protein